MLIPDATPPDLGVWPHAARDSLPPYFREVGEADGGVIDDPEVLAPGDVAENPVEHFFRDPLAGSHLLAMAYALRVFEIDPPTPIAFKHPCHFASSFSCYWSTSGCAHIVCDLGDTAAGSKLSNSDQNTRVYLSAKRKRKRNKSGSV